MIERWDSAERYVLERGDALGKTHVEARDAAGKLLQKSCREGGRWVAQAFNSNGPLSSERIYYDQAAAKLYQFRAWAGSKLTDFEQYTTSGWKEINKSISTSGNWVERSYDNRVETSVRIWNSAGKYLGDQMQNFKDAAAKLDPTTKSWWKL